MTFGEAFGKGMRAERARVSMRQDELAEKVGKSRGWVGQVESADISISLEDALAVALAIGVPFATLLADADDDVLRSLF